MKTKEPISEKVEEIPTEAMYLEEEDAEESPRMSEAVLEDPEYFLVTIENDKGERVQTSVEAKSMTEAVEQAKKNLNIKQ